MGRQTVKLTHISELPKDKITEKTYGDDDFWNKLNPYGVKKQRLSKK